MFVTSDSKHIRYLEARGPEAFNYLEALANLRMQVFKDFPYLYDGDLEYEKNYLKTYFATHNSFVVLAIDSSRNDLIIGASTAILLPEAEPAFRQPFLESGIDENQVCYFGESVLLANYRGLGIGKEFMNARLRFAQSKGMKKAAFCAVQRQAEHPLKPSDYRPLNDFWIKIGFQIAPALSAEYDWKDIDQKQTTTKKMQFWIKDIEF